MRFGKRLLDSYNLNVRDYLSHFKFQIFLASIGGKLLDIADDFESRRLYRFAEQVRGASLSISNNIAEESGSSSNKEFANFFNIAKRSAFENANMVIVFEKQGLITAKDKDEMLKDLEEECKMISGFIRSFKNK